MTELTDWDRLKLFVGAWLIYAFWLPDWLPLTVSGGVPLP